jgi:hypothetical protein
MPARRRKKKPGGALSGVAATLFPFCQDVPCLDMSEFQKRPGDLIAEAMQSAGTPARKRKRPKPRRRASTR